MSLGPPALHTFILVGRWSKNASRFSRASRRARTCWLQWRHSTSASAKGQLVLTPVHSLSERMAHVA
jgi:hypothetical protein